MAEDVVLANLIINADGTVVAVNRAGQSLASLERQTVSGIPTMERTARTGFERIGLSAKRLTDSFFNIRRLASGLFLGFSVGGIVFALGNLIRETIISTEWFQKLKESVLGVIDTIVTFGNEAEASSRKAARAAKAAGITTAESIQENIKAVKAFIAAEQERSQFAETQTNALKNLAVAITKLKELEQAYKDLGKAAKEAKQEGFIQHLGPGLDIFQPFSTPKEPAKGLPEGPQKFIEESDLARQTMEANTEAAEANAAALEILSHRYDLLSGAIQSAAAATVDMIASGELSAKKLLAIILKAIATEAVVKGAFEIAEGFAALGRYDPVSASAHFTSAAKFFAIGVLAAVGAGAVGGSTGGGGGRSGQRAISRAETAQTTIQPQAQVREVHVTIDGLKGVFIGSEAEMGRMIAQLLIMADRDNAGARA